jgi:prepilin-type N-terminal cleavage/methylation domain-containing protein
MNRNKFLTRAQRGFTLVEIAIVLVIIGLLLGGVLKGQEMIENGRIKSVIGDMNGISAAYNSYLDRYHAIPGDETNAVMGVGATGRGWLGNAAGNGNGVLDTLPPVTFTNAAVEQGAMWRALRASGLAAGNPASPSNATGLPRAGTGGLIGVSVGPYGLIGPSVCVTGLTAKQAAGIDNAIDGPGASNATGSVRGTSVTPLVPGVAIPGALPYNESLPALWTLCKQL